MTESAPRSLLITTALTYANGPLHLGHMIEAIQADIWTRFQKEQGHHCIFISGSDAHGTPIMLAAEKNNSSPEALVTNLSEQHQRNFSQFSINFDHYTSTHSDTNKQYTYDMYQSLQNNNDIKKRVITQAYDEQCKQFLADRYIKGECPKCHAQDQYGDNCEACGTVYEPLDLINPRSTLSNTTPIEKTSEHYFFNLENHRETLLKWLDSDSIHPAVANKLREWFNEPLRDWDISRDAPYFGFLIPGTLDKYFYVWLDAPIGYIAGLADYLANHPTKTVADYWSKGSTAEVYHFTGKDIVNFHGLFWPAILKSANYRSPTALFTHGYLTIDGNKMSKSRGTFITAERYLSQLNSDYLRYYFAAKLSGNIDDIDLNLEDFMQRINADLVGKFINLASRCAGFITKKSDGLLAKELHEPDLHEEFISGAASIAQCYDSLDYNKAMRMIMSLADKANQYIDHHKPWALAKDPNQQQQVQAICSQGLNFFRILSIMLKPVLPATTVKIEAFLQCPAFNWKDINTPLLNHTIAPFKPLLQRIQPEDIEALKDNINV